MSMKREFFIAVLLFLASCADGGSESESSIAGTWLFTLALAENTCEGLDPDAAVSPLYLVNQNGPNVVAENVQTDLVLTGGTIEGGRGMAVGAQVETAGCTTDYSIAMTMSEDDDDVSLVWVSMKIHCPPYECEVGYEGFGERQS